MSSSIFRIQEHVVETQHVREYPGATRDNQEEVCHLHVKQYTPLDSDESTPGAVTIIGAHANGFPKELYEPFWEEIHLRSKAAGFSIRSIWIADVAQQGQSGILNEDILGNDPSWMDHSRDLLHMTNVFRAQMPRPLVGIGHSMGGCQLVNLSLLHPRLLTTLILLDPIISAAPSVSLESKSNVAALSTFRRDIWPSRQLAAASFAKSPYYQRWDPRVLSLWLRYGLRHLPTAVYPSTPATMNPTANDSDEQPVTLTTTKHQEVWTFLRPNYTFNPAAPPSKDNVWDRTTHPDLDISSRKVYPFYSPDPTSTFHQLPHLRPSVLYVFGDESGMSDREQCAHKMAVTGIGLGGSGGEPEGRVKQVRLVGVGHLIPMESVDGAAAECVRWLGPETGRWRAQEDEWRVRRRRKDPRDWVVVDEEWKRRMDALRGGAKTKL